MLPSLELPNRQCCALSAAGAVDPRALGPGDRRGPGLRGLRPGPLPRGPGLPSRRAAAEGAGEPQRTPSQRALAWSASAGERRNLRERAGAAAGGRPDALLRCAGQLHRQLLLVPGASESPLVTTWLGSIREKRALGRRGGARNHRRSGSAGGGRAAAWRYRAAPQLGFPRGSKAGWCRSRQPGRGRRGARCPQPLAAACPT